MTPPLPSGNPRSVLRTIFVGAVLFFGAVAAAAYFSGCADPYRPVKDTSFKAQAAMAEFEAWDEAELARRVTTTGPRCDRTPNPTVCLLECLVPYQQDRQAVVVPRDLLRVALRRAKVKGSDPVVLERQIISVFGDFLRAVEGLKKKYTPPPIPIPGEKPPERPHGPAVPTTTRPS